MLKAAAFTALLLIAGCRHKALIPANVAGTPAVAGPPEYETLYKEGRANAQRQRRMKLEAELIRAVQSRSTAEVALVNR